MPWFDGEVEFRNQKIPESRGSVASPNQVNQPNPNMDSCAAPGVSGSGPGLAAAAGICTVSLFMVSLDTA